MLKTLSKTVSTVIRILVTVYKRVAGAEHVCRARASFSLLQLGDGDRLRPLGFGALRCNSDYPGSNLTSKVRKKGTGGDNKTFSAC